MHELGIATSILETVEKEAAKHPGMHFEKVGLRIGELAGIDVDALTFGWDAIVKDTPWESLQLEVELVPRKNRCEKCGSVFDVHDLTEIDCPQCGTCRTCCVGGDELDIAYIEAEELEAAIV